MSWKPIPEAKLWDEINAGWDRMNGPQRRFWETIRIDPEKWQQHPWGDLGEGFWAVAILGRTVLWYNDIEHGFNSSHYTHYRSINDYWCNQEGHEWAVQHLMNRIEIGYDPRGQSGPPQAAN